MKNDELENLKILNKQEEKRRKNTPSYYNEGHSPVIHEDGRQ